jgi:anti-sigma factor RsiW
MKKPWKFPFRSSDRPMTCGEVGKWLQHFLDGEVDERRSQRLAAHLDDCRRCGLESDVYHRIKEALAAHQPSVSAESLARLREFGARIARGDEPVER